MDNLFSLAFRCLTESRLEEKLTLSELVSNKILSGTIEVSPLDEDIKIIKVGRPDKPLLIDPRDLPRRNMQNDEGRTAMMRAGQQ